MGTAAWACSASASINHHSSDPDDDKLTFVQAPPGPYGLGVTPVTLTVSDPYGGSNSCMANVTVVDTTPPHIFRLTASPSVLWPPNNKWVPVRLSASAFDACDGNVANSCQIAWVSTHERGGHDRDTDYQITGNLTVNLRAERDTEYTIGVTCTDAAGNGATRTVKVTVP